MNVVKLVVSLLLCFSAAAVGSIFTVSSIGTWYAGLVKPPLNPPNWIFGPVWSLLYLAMAISFYLVWRKKHSSLSIQIFLFQLVMNILWSFVFFYLHHPGLAFGVIIVLWLSILATITVFRRTSRPAAYLLYPYLSWVTFASYLNFSIWRLN